MKYLKDMDSEVKNLKHELLKICWYMRGGVSYQESLNMSVDERKIVGNIVKDNLLLVFEVLTRIISMSCPEIACIKHFFEYFVLP